MLKHWNVIVLLFFISLHSLHTTGQQVYGTVKDDAGTILPYSSILIKGTTQGVTANSNGAYTLNILPGTYKIICQHVGYAAQEKTVVVSENKPGEAQSNAQNVVFILAQQKLLLKEVIVKSGSEDPAYAIIRAAIKKRVYYKDQVNAFECEAYIKGLIKLRNMPKRVLGRKVPDADRKEMMLDSAGKGIIYLSESVTRVSVQKPKKFKLEVVSGRQSGGSGFGFNFPTFISLYANNVSMFAGRLNPRGFISPIADGALKYYKYKYLGSFFEDGKEINVIRVIPKRSYEPLFSGMINITEGDWRIHSCDLLLTKSAQLEILDTLQLTQIYVPVDKDVWRVKNQLIHFNFKQFGIDAVGNFVNVYGHYKINPVFPSNYFDRVIIRYDTSANKKTNQYWDTIRPVPLEPEEAHDYKIKDSLYLYRRDSANSRSNIDSLRKHQAPVTINNIFISGVNRTHYSVGHSFTYHIEPVIKSLQYTSVEGIAVNLTGDYQTYLKKSKTNFTIAPGIRYGFNNQRLYGWVDLSFATRDWSIDKKLKRESWTIAGGKRVSQFNKESNISTLGNTIGTLFSGNNYMKFYENYFGQLGFTKQLENGLRFSIEGLYEDRSPLDNTTDFVLLKKKEGKFTPNYPYEILSSNFQPHKALIANASISFKPGQKYIQYPFNKVSIGSKFPTFTLNYSKGLSDIFGSNVDFDKWSFVIDHSFNMKLAGSIKYKAMAGGFLNARSVFIQDYQHFNGNRSHIAKEYLNTFQLQSYYANSTTSNLFSAFFFEHHYNGFLTNKIPLFRRLNWHLVDGANILYISPMDPYAEVFVGLENIFKVLRVDFIGGLRNGFKPNFDVKVGVDGLIGGRVRVNKVKGRSGL